MSIAGSKRKAPSTSSGNAEKRVKVDAVIATTPPSASVAAMESISSPKQSAKRKASSSPGSASKRVKVDDKATTVATLTSGDATTAETKSSPEKQAKKPAIGMKNRRTTGKGVAQKVVKKKPQTSKEETLSPDEEVPDTTNAGSSSVDAAEKAARAPENVLSVDDEVTPEPAMKQSSLNGLLNARNACFMNSIIQMLDAALEGQDVDSILAHIDDLASLNDFDGHDLSRFDLDASLDDFASSRSRRSKRKLTPATQKKAALRAAIKQAAKDGKTDQLSIAKRLRQLLNQLHEEQASKNENYISPFQFQQIFAFGKIDEADRPVDDTDDGKGRHWSSGDTQEDASNFYMALLNALDEDQHAVAAEKLRELFTIHATERVVCQDGCKYKGELKNVTNSYHQVRVPRIKQKTGEAVELVELMAKSFWNDHEGDCPKCGKPNLRQAHRIAVHPENLVIKLQRTDRKGKIPTHVRVPLFIKRPSAAYELKGVVKHRGQSAHSGHYTFLRKRSEKWAGDLVKNDWWMLDDDHVYGTVDRATQDDAKSQCAMLLYQKFEPKQETR